MATSVMSSPRLLAYLLAGAAVVSFAEFRPQAAGPISGLVFEDFNGNGVYDTTVTVVNDGGAGVTPAAVDRGRAGIEVRAFDAAGNQSGATVVTNAAGQYSIATTGAGPYRVEFTNLPVGYQPSAVATGATGNASTVQFVPVSVPSTNVDWATEPTNTPNTGAGTPVRTCRYRSSYRIP